MADADKPTKIDGYPLLSALIRVLNFFFLAANIFTVQTQTPAKLMTMSVARLIHWLLFPPLNEVKVTAVGKL